MTVVTNTQLQLAPSAGSFDITNSLLIQGSGVVGDGGLLNVSGNNTWAGPVVMDGDSTFGVNSGTLTISGVISDSTVSNLSKVGTGTLIFPGAEHLSRGHDRRKRHP